MFTLVVLSAIADVVIRPRANLPSSLEIPVYNDIICLEYEVKCHNLHWLERILFRVPTIRISTAIFVITKVHSAVARHLTVLSITRKLTHFGTIGVMIS